MADVKISDLPAAGAITGAELVPIVQSGVTSQSTVDGIKNGSVKVYRALLTHSGTAAPVAAVVLENTLGATPTFARTGQGNFYIEISGGFVPEKTFVSSIGSGAYNGDVQTVLFGNDSGRIYFITQKVSGGNTVGVDDWGDYIPFEILVYP